MLTNPLHTFDVYASCVRACECVRVSYLRESNPKQHIWCYARIDHCSCIHISSLDLCGIDWNWMLTTLCAHDRDNELHSNSLTSNWKKITREYFAMRSNLNIGIAPKTQAFGDRQSIRMQPNHVCLAYFTLNAASYSIAATRNWVIH